MQNLLSYLSEAEGKDFHRNSKEADITSMCGIYKVAHPNAKIWDKLRKLTLHLNIPSETKDWNASHLKQVNDLINGSAIVHQEFIELVAEFYEEYYKGANLNLLPQNCTVAMVSMFTTSPKNANRAIQLACNAFIANGVINHPVLLDDGDIGTTSKKCLQLVLDYCGNDLVKGYWFETLMLLNMCRLYAKIAVENPTVQLLNLNGWMNRMQTLTMLK